MHGEWNVEKKLESQLRKKQIKDKDVQSIKKKADAIQGKSSSSPFISYLYHYRGNFTKEIRFFFKNSSETKRFSKRI